ncbi:MAG: hypothetical protein AABX61_02420 [Nanoarchaeota archaeon]
MKKGVILLLILLANLDLVNAQEIDIFGNTYPIIYVAPVFFMALMTLFFLGLVIKDNIGKFKFPKIQFGKISLKHHEKKEIINEVKTDYRLRFNLLKQKLFKIGKEQSLNEFSEIAKAFFKEKFNIKHEFAFAELGNLVKGHIKDVTLSNKLSNIKYSGASFDSSQIKSLFRDFEELLRDYNVKEEKAKLGFFDKVKENFLNVFKKKETKLSMKELNVRIPLKKLEIKEIEKPEIQEEPNPVKRYKFVLFRNIMVKIEKIRILNLIKDGIKALDRNPLIAKRYYARALLAYYKLPIIEEKEIMTRLMDLHDGILSKKKNEKMFLDVSRNLIEIKHQGKYVSRESISLLNTLKNFIEREGLLASSKLKEFSHKLKHEERKMGHFVKKEDVNENLIGDVEKFGGNLNRLTPKREIARQTINLVDHYNPKLEFLYKQPKFKVEHVKEEKEHTKKTSKELRMLQKQRSELYHKLLELESGKLTHDKLN